MENNRSFAAFETYGHKSYLLIIRCLWTVMAQRNLQTIDTSILPE